MIPDFFNRINDDDDNNEEKLKIEVIEEFNTNLKYQRNELSKENLSKEELNQISNWINLKWKTNLKKLESFKDLKEEEIEFICSLSSLTRDLVVINLSFQDLLKPSIEIILKTLWFTSSIINQNQPKLILFNQRSIQSISNLITKNQDSISTFWSLISKTNQNQSVLLRLIEFNQSKIVSSIVILLINCIHESKPRIQSLYESEILIKILRNLLELLDNLIDDDQSNCFDLIVSLVCEILNLNEFEKFYKSQESSIQPISKSQLSILKIQESINSNQLTLKSYQFLIKSIPKDFNKLIYNTTIFKDLNFFFNLFNGILLKNEMIIIFLENQVENSIRLKIKDEIKQNRIENNEVDQEDYQINQEEISELIKSSIMILSKFNLNFLKNQNLNLNLNEIQLILTKLLILICKLISSLCESYGLIIQELVREFNGIQLILKLNEFNPDLPYLSEHSLFCIRNLLVQNVKNQTYIESLKKSK